jgi:hypothetical protein
MGGWNYAITQGAKIVKMANALPVIIGSSRLRRFRGVNISTISPPEGRTWTNPTIVRHENRFVVGVREVSYRVDWRGRYTSWTTPPESRTWFGPLSADATEVHLETRLSEHKSRDSLVLEDPRFVSWRGEIIGVWAARDYSTGRYVVEMMTGHVSNGVVSEISAIASPHGAPVEKNWMPYVENGDICFLYRADRLERYRLSDEGRLELIGRSAEPVDGLEGQSGSSQIVPFGQGWIGVTHAHSIIALPFKLATWRFYRHHFIEFAQDFSAYRLSSPFNFIGAGIEFCSGLALNGSSLLVGFGSKDSSAHVAKIPLQVLQSLMRGRPWVPVSFEPEGAQSEPQV